MGYFRFCWINFERVCIQLDSKLSQRDSSARLFWIRSFKTFYICWSIHLFVVYSRNRFFHANLNFDYWNYFNYFTQNFRYSFGLWPSHQINLHLEKAYSLRLALSESRSIDVKTLSVLFPDDDSTAVSIHTLHFTASLI